jgi:hypothetical protein
MRTGKRKPGASLIENGRGTGFDGLKDEQCKIIEPFQAFPDEMDELFEGP